MISLLPEETAGLLSTGSSPPLRPWFCRVQQPRAARGRAIQGIASRRASFCWAGTPAALRG